MEVASLVSFLRNFVDLMLFFADHWPQHSYSLSVLCPIRGDSWKLSGALATGKSQGKTHRVRAEFLHRSESSEFISLAMDYTVLVALLWSWVGVWAWGLIRGLVPPDFFRLLEDYKRNLLRKCSLYFELVVPELSGPSTNDVYKAVHLCINSKALEASTESLVAECPVNATKLHFELGRNQFLWDEFEGVKMKWERCVSEKQSRDYFTTTERSYRLVLPMKAKHLVPGYLNHLLKKGRELDTQKRDKKLYANLQSEYWASVVFNPPATFETVAMEPVQKKLLMDDLQKFLTGKDYYRKVGRTWKRGYLLYGPPGTGKSSLIGAMANLTGYDVYDLELTKVNSNTDLKQLLISMKNQAIVVVEDIDCSLSAQSREEDEEKLKSDENEGDSENGKCRKKKKRKENGITLSGLLNFTDGLWSCCGSERIFVFTTNYVEKLDPALLRPGRMDMHISMSYCSFPVFKILAEQYLMLEEHYLFSEIELLLNKARITPAEVIEFLLRHDSDADLALEQLVSNLEEREAKIQSQDSMSLDEDVLTASP